MLENWIVGGASPFGSVNGLPQEIPPRSEVENSSGATWIKRQLQAVDSTRAYSKTIDAKEYFAKIDLHECRTNCPSFDKLCRELLARVPPPFDSENPQGHTPS